MAKRKFCFINFTSAFAGCLCCSFFLRHPQRSTVLLTAIRKLLPFAHTSRRVRSVLSPRCGGAAARRAGLSPLHCEASISCRPVCFLKHTFPPIAPLALGCFPSSCGWIFSRGAKGGNLPVGRTHARNPTARPAVAQCLLRRGDLLFRPHDEGGPYAHHVHRRSPTHLRHQGH